MSSPSDPVAMMRSGRYVALLAVAAALGVPIAATAYFFLKAIDLTQHWVYSDAPDGLGLSPVPTWWPLIPMTVAGVAVGVVVRWLPGHGGERPISGFRPGRTLQPVTLPGVAIAAFVSIGLGAVIGPEGPLVALGGGLAYFLVGMLRRLPVNARNVLAASGAFAAISTLLGTPLAAAFLLLEAAGLSGQLATAVLLPGLLAAGVGALIFTGLDSLTGFGTFSLAIPHLPPAGTPTVAEFGYAVLLGVAAAVLCSGVRVVAGGIGSALDRHVVTLTTVIGAATGALAFAYANATNHATSDLLFSGQSSLPALVNNGGTYTVGALLLLVAFKGLAYSGALVAFRGGPTFPAMFIGAAGGIAASHLPGLGMVAGVAIGLGAMATGMLRLPLTAVLLTTLFLGTDGFSVIPLTVVAVVVCHVVSLRLSSANMPATVLSPRVAQQPEPVTRRTGG